MLSADQPHPVEKAWNGPGGLIKKSLTPGFLLGVSIWKYMEEYGHIESKPTSLHRTSHETQGRGLFKESCKSHAVRQLTQFGASLPEDRYPSQIALDY